MMANQATHFIEQVKFDDAIYKHLTPQPFTRWDESQRINKKFNVDVVAVFKVYPKAKPAIATYGYDLKTTIID